MTTISAFLFCAVIVAASLSPLALFSFFSDHLLFEVIFVFGVSLAAAAVNVIWFVAAFRSGAEKTSVNTLT
nr:hypothetical protein [Bacillus subtilis]